MPQTRKAARRAAITPIMRFMREVGISDRRLAHELGIEWSTVFRIRTGRTAPSGDTLRKLVRWSRKTALQHGIQPVSADDLLGL